ncbi:nicotinamide-nucleotide amidase [Catalinimonas alkaloidigena]|uniref:competence/damage-inducible protein A n=1 Tax=Catalinimonas alkaloidigena TaxID=1075417 RepID=UPI0024056E61|nr:competence/damage-inducible protein A [Catalinimonas alkaloidigena]MDF9797741.1 nicotinamide-nucleotide amidase [Catalinimonas alkaloidigena]
MKNVYAEVITIGDEILYGQTLDTNTHWMGQRLNEMGIKILRKVAIGDAREEILSALDEASGRADIILMTGGLGPTKDDITKYTLAEYFGMPLKRNEQALAHIKALFASRGRNITPTNERQADLPEGCTMVHNRMGTAAAMWFERSGKIYVSMPGVPYEMKTIMDEEVLPRVKEKFSLPVIFHQMIQTVGIGESWLSDKIADWEDNLPAHIRLAYLPSLGCVKLRLTALGEDLTTLKKQVMEEVDKVMPLIDEYVFALGNVSLEEAIGNMLKAQQKTLALAESCSGGYVAHSLTSLAGSSAYFQGAVVPYHNQLKEEVLGVSYDTLLKNGAVSEETVIEMAKNIRKLMHSDFGLASSGIAGPGGGTEDKPVGTIWIAVANDKEVKTQKLQLTKDRMLNINLTKVALLNLLRKQL